MSIFTPRMNPYLHMNEEDFYQESLRVFDTRIILEKAIDLLKLQKKGVPASDYRPKFNSQKASYSMHEVLDVSHFSDCKTLEIDIEPMAKFGDKEFSFRKAVIVDGKELHGWKAEEKMNLIHLDLLQYISRMDDYFQENQRIRGWKGLRR